MKSKHRLNLTFTGGMPFKQYTLSKMQDAYEHLSEAISSFIGVNPVGNFIISGVVFDGANITPGWLCMDGVLLYFDGLTPAPSGVATKLKRNVTAENVPFKNAISNPVYETYSVAVDETGAALSTFTRITEIGELPENVMLSLHSGMINLPAIGTLGAIETISFDDLGTDEYQVIGTIESIPISGGPVEIIPMYWEVRSITSDSFQLRIMKLINEEVNINFHYTLLKL